MFTLSGGRYNIKIFFVLVVIIFAVYGKSIFFDFVYFDDDILILDKQNYLKISNIKNILSDPVFARENDKYYRPVLNLSFLIDNLVYKTNPAGYHLTNILIHLFAVFSVFLLLSYKHDKSLALLFTAVFAVHPALVKAVAWIPGRNDTLLTLFSVFSFYFFINYCEKQKWQNWIFCISFFTLALFTKETAVITLPLFIIYLILKKLNLKKYVSIITILSVITVIFFIVRHFVFSYQTVNPSFSVFLNSALKNMPVILKYMQMTIFPVDLSVIVSKIEINYFIFSYTLFLFLLLFFLSRNNKNSIRTNLFCVIWFILYLIPACLVPNNNYDSHRIYLPMVGVFLFFIESAEIFYLSKKRLIGTFIILLFIIFCSISYIQTDKFKNKKIFWINALLDNPQSAVANANVAGLLTDAGKFNEAEDKYLKAISIEPWESKHYVNLAVVYIKTHNMERSEKYLLTAIKLNPLNEIAYYNLAVIYRYQGKKEQALEMKTKYLEVFKIQNRYDKPSEIKL